MSVMGSMRIQDKLWFKSTAPAAQEAYISYTTAGGLQVYVNNQRALTMESDGGMLHGSWQSEAAIITSDRRLKKDIVPLQRSLRSAIETRLTEKSSAAAEKGQKLPPGGSPEAKEDSALWMLRQLRPVSYSFKKGADSKYMRFGFIADELENVVPEVVRERAPDRSGPETSFMKGQKGVVYQDLIALLTAASQAQNIRLDSLGNRFDDLEAELERMRKEEIEDRALMRKVKRKLRERPRPRRSKRSTVYT